MYPLYPFTFIGSFLLQLNKIDIFLSSDGRRSISNRDITFNFPWVSIYLLFSLCQITFSQFPICADCGVAELYKILFLDNICAGRAEPPRPILQLVPVVSNVSSRAVNVYEISRQFPQYLLISALTLKNLLRPMIKTQCKNSVKTQ